MLTPVALRELCIALDLLSPETDRQVGVSWCPITHRRTFFLEQESHALRLGLLGPLCDSGKRLFSG